MSDRKPLMPKATAVWLVENTTLSFDQIAEFCGLHSLEVKGIADDDPNVVKGIKGYDPITSGQLTRDEIERGEKDPEHKLELAESKVVVPPTPTRKGPRYTPVSRRHDRPNAVLWLLKNHAELKDSQIMRLVGTTKPTIAQIRDRTHWNSQNLVQQDPVTLGLCSQVDLDAEVQKAARRVERERKQAEKEAAKAGTLLPAEETTGAATPEPLPAGTDQPAPVPEHAEPAAEIVGPKDSQPREESESEEAARVLAKLKELSGGEEQPKED